MKKKVLVVEDELSLQKAVTKSLLKIGVDSYSAKSADEAISHLESYNDIGAIWLDHYLLNNDTGLDFLEKVKNNKKWAGLPVVVVTNSVDDDKVKNYHLLGIENYYVKSDTSIYKVMEDVVKFMEIREKKL